ncbi:uncharacterized protein LOC111614589 [Centruroides sculpturatus]|uniref:uncharacterized protein LOC111614589 n=1 Tax=Centruroides sculpturatus TaxID=218467 RepID=UPI000C6D519F|nr:uncharacterized protein LOC111614589 [Centruroides sculpturatus]
MPQTATAKKLISGTEFCIKDDDDDDVPEENNLNYFNNEELLKALNRECLYFQNENDDENNNDDFDVKTPFEKMMKTMTPLVENQIFKKELKTGFGIELPNKAFVTVHYNFYLEYNDEPFDSTRLRDTPYKFVITGDLLRCTE